MCFTSPGHMLHILNIISCSPCLIYCHRNKSYSVCSDSENAYLRGKLFKHQLEKMKCIWGDHVCLYRLQWKETFSIFIYSQKGITTRILRKFGIHDKPMIRYLYSVTSSVRPPLLSFEQCRKKYSDPLLKFCIQNIIYVKVCKHYQQNLLIFVSKVKVLILQ